VTRLLKSSNINITKVFFLPFFNLLSVFIILFIILKNKKREILVIFAETVFSGVLTENYLVSSSVSPGEPSTKTIPSTPPTNIVPTSELPSLFVQSFESFMKILEEFKNMEEEMEFSLFCDGFIWRMQGVLLLLFLLLIIISLLLFVIVITVIIIIFI
jgi:hypothetical protein